MCTRTNIFLLFSLFIVHYIHTHARTHARTRTHAHTHTHSRRVRKNTSARLILSPLSLGSLPTQVVNCFAVPHSEKQEEVAVGQTFNRSMYNLHSAVNKKEQIVGWYATSMDGSLIVDSSSLIHDFYAQVRSAERVLVAA